MTATLTAGGAHRAPATTTVRGVVADFTGTGHLLRLALRRDRSVLPVWAILIGLMPVFQFLSIRDLYTTQAQLDTLAQTTAANPALRAMYGPVFSSELGSIGTWEGGAMYSVIAIAAVLTVIRHTRVEEESGRAELVASTAVGRFAGLTSALLLTWGGALLAGIVCGASLYASDLPAAGSVAFGAALAGSGALWAGVSAVAAQASAGARVARGVAFSALGAAFGLRAAGDAGNGVLSWFSPLGWSAQIRPFADERWWVLILLSGGTALTVTAAYSLLRHRDTGSGMLAERPGPARAAPTLNGPWGLATRLQRGTLLGWTFGFVLYGLLIGGTVGSIGDMLAESEELAELVTRMGGSESLEDSFIAYAVTVLAAAAAAYSVSAALRLHEEETGTRTELVLACSVGRIRYAASHLGYALLGPAVALLAAALAIGGIHGATTDDLGGQLSGTLGAALVQLPAVWVVTGLTVALLGFLPRYAPLAWGVLSTLIAVYFIGSFDLLPDWTMNLVPFNHPPKLPGAEFTATPILWLLAIAAALLTAGLFAYRRRDIG